MKANTAQQMRGFIFAQDLLEALAEVRVQIVQHQMDASGRTVDLLDQAACESDKIDLAYS